MTTFEFSIIASGLDPAADDFETRFYEAGCDDATVSFQRGHIIVDFAREAETFDEAVASAVDCVVAAGAHVDRIEPDPLVSLSEIAARTGMSRAAMTQYSKGQRGKGFPPPSVKVTSDSPLWDWATVARWLYRQSKVSRETVLQAEIVKDTNAALGAGEGRLRDHLRARAREHEAAL